jgi:hypothetical protein
MTEGVGNTNRRAPHADAVYAGARAPVGRISPKNVSFPPWLCAPIGQNQFAPPLAVCPAPNGTLGFGRLMG